MPPALETTTQAAGIWSGWTVISAAVGYAVAIGTEWLKDAGAHKREREARVETRRNARLDRRDEIQYRTVVSLQRWLQKSMVATAEMHFLDSEAAKAGKGWRTELYPEELNSRAHKAGVNAMLFSFRVHDKELRDLMTAFVNVDRR